MKLLLLNNHVRNPYPRHTHTDSGPERLKQLVPEATGAFFLGLTGSETTITAEQQRCLVSGTSRLICGPEEGEGRPLKWPAIRRSSSPS